MSLDIWLSIDTGGPELASLDISYNYTHNVTFMWAKAGCYDALYNSNGKLAREIIGDLRKAIIAMEEDPKAYKALNPKNGWGDYEGALAWLKALTDEFALNPNATIGVWK